MFAETDILLQVETLHGGRLSPDVIGCLQINVLWSSVARLGYPLDGIQLSEARQGWFFFAHDVRLGY